MKVFFVGDGEHDVGPSDNQQDSFPARGVVPTLARRIAPAIDSDCLATHWARLTRLSKAKRGYEAKAKAAVLVAERRFGCDGVVLVADQDGKPEEHRLEQLQAAREEGGLPVACGVAVESIEAWTLGAPEAIAEELHTALDRVKRLYPSAPVEHLKETSGREDHRPKALLQRVAQSAHQHDSVEFREGVAARTDPKSLAAACPQGFAPFMAEVEMAFGRMEGDQ